MSRGANGALGTAAGGARARRAMGATLRNAAPFAALLLGFVAIGGCGQRGPLTLPDSARPIERLDPAAQAPGGAAEPRQEPTTAPAPAERRESEDDEARGDARGAPQ